jgi:hypothetical protein
MSNSQEFIIKIDEKSDKSVEISKKSAVSAATKIYSSIMDSGVSALKVAEMFKYVDETLEQLKEMTDAKGKNKFVDLVREEIKTNSDNGKSATTKNGTKFEFFEAGTKYDYSACGDPIWNRLNGQMETLKVKMKDRESFLKGLKGETVMGNVIDPETSELFEDVKLYPPIKNSTPSYKQTLITG